jgi:hypothetical protein
MREEAGDGGAMDERQRIRMGWADFSRRVRWHFSVGIGGFMVFGAMAAAILAGKLSESVGHSMFVAWGLTMMGTSLRVHLFRCPYCGSRFLGAFWGAPQRCQNCGVVRDRLPPASTRDR